ncbi:MAG TPA: cytochrome b N-terminal domain-containing protein [Polyangiaceae bacterium]|jgi:ubiquinol-cytochrome c reductase cytochrome b subunit|nr:cytochrome b N-terminal domain-containing protein [Polyangiaceae bacterium]
MKALIDWLDERAGVRALWAELANEPIPGGARPRYVFGSVLMFLFMQQVVLGILLASYYSPSASDAWASTQYLNDQVTAGWFLRGLHHHGSSAMVILTALHFLQTFIAGAYRRPRELNWLAGIAMGGLVLGFALTGYLLPWDQKGYWATQVATGIMGSVPGGEPLRVLLQGGNEYGNLTLTRFYTLHVFVLPVGLAALLGIHLALFRKHGVTPPVLPQEELDRKMQYFFPSQLLWDVIAMAVTSAVLVIVTFSTHGAELFAPAQPASNFVARPEWYFLTLFQLLKYFEGPLQLIATVIIPGAVTTFLVLLPWLDRAQSRKAGERMPVVAGVALLMTGVVTLTALAMVEDSKNEKFQKGLAAAHAEAERARDLAKIGVLPTGGDAVFENDPQVGARNLFKEHCENCHTLGGSGGEEAPNLTDYKSREWLSAVIRNPRDKRFFGGTKTHKEMEPYPAASLPDDKLKAVVEYLTSLMGPEAGSVDAALVANGQKLFADDLDCNTCHEVKPGESGDGPNLSGSGSKAWIIRLLHDSSADDLFGKSAGMPKFGKKLTDDEMKQLSDLIAAQRGVKGSG